MKMRQLSKDDMNFYINHKYQKLESRRKNILKEIANKYKNSLNFEQTHKSIQNIKYPLLGKTRYQKYQESILNNRLQSQYRRLKILEKIKTQQIQSIQTNQNKKQNYFQKLAIATQKRQAYRSLTIRQSPDKLIIQNQKRRMQKVKQQNKQIELESIKLNEKLQKANQIRIKKQKQIQKIHISKNKQKLEKIKDHKLNQQKNQKLQTQKILNQIQQDLQLHEKNRSKRYQIKLEKLKIKQLQLNQKVQQIKSYQNKKEEQQYQLKLKQLKQKNFNASLQKEKILKQESQKFFKKRSMSIDQVNKLKKRKRQNEEQQEQKIKKIIEQRQFVEQQIHKRKISLGKKKRRLWILQSINNEIAELNQKRTETIQSRHLKQIEQNIQYENKKFIQWKNRKEELYKSRQKIKILLNRKKQQITFYYDTKHKDFTKRHRTSKQTTDSFFPTQIRLIPQSISIDHPT